MMILRSLGYGQKTTEHKILEEAQTIFEELNATKQQYFDPSKLVHLSVTNVICYLLFNEKYAHDDAEFDHLLKMLYQYFTLGLGSQAVAKIPILGYFPSKRDELKRLRSTTDILHKFITKKIRQRKEALDKGGDVCDFIQVQLMLTFRYW